MSQVMPQRMNRLTKYGINGFARQLFLPIFTAALVFTGAGTLDWSWGWVFAYACFFSWLGLNLALLRWNPELLNIRGQRARELTGTKTWDWVLLSIYAVVLIVQPLLAGLDFRNGWSTPPPIVWLVVGNVLTVVAVAMIAWAMVYNRFFEGTVRIQEQRGHQVVSSGPYRLVRHPGYVGVILSFVALPLALGTWTALIPGLIGIVVYLVRTALEDRTLRAELPGYADYAQHTRHRLIPGVW
jgi:protein-S-isoprenylcysteine O-methyltransferase Ste14